MATLKKTLRKQGYDLIDGPIRTHKLLQIWLKRPMDAITSEYSHVTHAFKSNVDLDVIEAKSLNVNSSQKDEYKFNIGLSVLKQVLERMGASKFDFMTKLKTGKSISISYDNAVTKEVEIGQLKTFFSGADFIHTNERILKDLNSDNFIIISGVLFAKNLIVEIETDYDISIELPIELNNLVDINIGFQATGKRKLKMTSESNISFPIAVRAHKIIYDKGEYLDLKIISDNITNVF